MEYINLGGVAAPRAQRISYDSIQALFSPDSAFVKSPYPFETCSYVTTISDYFEDDLSDPLQHGLRVNLGLLHKALDL